MKRKTTGVDMIKIVLTDRAAGPSHPRYKGCMYLECIAGTLEYTGSVTKCVRHFQLASWQLHGSWKSVGFRRLRNSKSHSKLQVEFLKVWR